MTDGFFLKAPEERSLSSFQIELTEAMKGAEWVGQDGGRHFSLLFTSHPHGICPKLAVSTDLFCPASTSSCLTTAQQYSISTASIKAFKVQHVSLYFITNQALKMNLEKGWEELRAVQGHVVSVKTKTL